ncbi:SNF2 helicase-associated domain-containing protein, partial [Peribacillus tepidiphilus]|uniref:SNF2 helicase-associated domain-containing protein n=1 Tax=Peribacillus tepidiphilus TaxID=2652445 RepID=UPI0035B550D1
MYSKLIVHTALMEDGRYVLTATDVEGFVIEPRAWANLLFIWDEASFYGTKLDINENLGGIVLDAWGILSLFSQDSFPSLVDWEWDEFSFLFLSTAPVLYDSIKSGVPIPDFSSLQSEQIGWQLPKQVLEEFEPDFWSNSIVFSNDEELPTKDFIHTLYNQAAGTYLKSFAPNHEKWEAALSALKKSQLTSEELQEFFTEERWSKWIGVQEDHKPFTAGLRLIEPLDGEGPWELEVILRSKKDETDFHVYGKEKKLPRGWKAHLHAVEEEIQGWLSLIPWLGTNGRIKQELSEAEAWDFLTEASEKLLFLGAEILLPSWWNAIKESQLKVKARVKSQSTRGASYVGLNALMDFDWRISMNGADLTEEEFQQLVSDKRRLVYIKGQWVKLDPSLIKQIQELMKTADNKGIPLSELFYQELLQEEVMEDEEEDLSDFMKIQFELNKDLKKLMASLREVKSIPMQEAPPSFQGSLRPYQVQGLSWLLYLRKHGFGACLADDMGLGKTVQVISYLLSVKEQEDLEAVDTSVSAKKDEAAAVTSLPVKKDEAATITSLSVKKADTGADSSLSTKNAETGADSSLPAKKAALIVCPTSVLGNWQRELEKFAPSLKVYLHYGSNRVKGEDFADFVG